MKKAMARSLSFTHEVEEYTVLKLLLNRYVAEPRSLEKCFRLGGAEIRSLVRCRERLLLKTHFLNWAKPYYGELPGWREDSPLYILHGSTLLGGVYLCAANEYGQSGFGQLHYAFMDPAYRGKGLYSVLFAEAVSRARIWGLDGLFLNSDRHLLPEVYLRWGAELYRQALKPKNPIIRATWHLARRAKNTIIILKHRHED